tara:strand:- start:45 stop:290 length:246 start_codon:yes stop_codon:yes gene_type:complete
METETLLLILTAVAIPTGLYLNELYKRVMADGTITLDEVLEEGKALLGKAEEVKDDVEEILEEAEEVKAEKKSSKKKTSKK